MDIFAYRDASTHQSDNKMCMKEASPTQCQEFLVVPCLSQVFPAFVIAFCVIGVVSPLQTDGSKSVHEPSIHASVTAVVHVCTENPSNFRSEVMK